MAAFSAEQAFDLWVNYNVPGFKRHGAWSVGLTARNIFSSDDDLIPIQAHGNGAVARYRYAPPRTIYLSSKFKF